MKNINVKYLNEKNKIEIDDNENYECFIKKLNKKLNIDYNKKIILFWNSKKINNENFNELNNNSIILCIVNDNIDLDKQKKYSFIEIQTTIVAFLQIIKDNEEFKKLYDNDIYILINLIFENEKIKNLIKNIIKKSENISQSFKNKENIDLVIDNK